MYAYVIKYNNIAIVALPVTSSPTAVSRSVQAQAWVTLCEAHEASGNLRESTFVQCPVWLY
jgi:hypothetical protein